MALGSTQPLTDVSKRSTSWGVKAVGTKVWRTCYLSVPIVWKSGSLKLLEHSGPVQGLLFCSMKAHMN